MAAVTISKNPTASDGVNILLIEDDDDDVYVLQTALLSEPRIAQVARAANGEEALAWLEATRRETRRGPDLIIVDLNMPVLDGHGFLARFREMEGFADVPVAVLTSSGTASDYHRALSRRANAFITKPNEFAQIATMVGQLLTHLLKRLRQSPS